MQVQTALEAHRYDRWLIRAISTRFYLLTTLTIALLVYIYVKKVNYVAIPILVAASVAIFSVIGAMYLHKHYKFRDEKFSSLLVLTLRLLPLIGKRNALPRRTKSTKSLAKKR